MNEEVNIRVFDTSKELLFQTQQWQDRPQVSSKLEAQYVTLSTGEESVQVMMPILSRNTRVLIGHLQVTNRMMKLAELKKQLRFFIPSVNRDGRNCLYWACLFHFATHFKTN